jgi:hypothetical protein
VVETTTEAVKETVKETPKPVLPKEPAKSTTAVKPATK